ncbi:MAG: hypothetical protein ABIT37_01080 [Luteolibacter sp.]
MDLSELRLGARLSRNGLGRDARSHGYEDAITLVLKQAEELADAWTGM